MEQPSNHIGLGVVPRFIFAGLLSSAYSLLALNKSELHEGANNIITVLVGGLCLGLLLVTALWFYGRLDSWRSAALLVAIMALANGFSLFDKYLPESLRQDNALPLLGITEHYDFRLFFPTCLVAFIGFAIVLLRWRNALRTVPIAFAFSVLATLAFNYQVKQGREGWINVLPGDVLGILWQMNLVLFLALGLWIGQIRISAGSSTVQASQVPSFRQASNGLISLGILVGCFIGVQLWTAVLIREERKRDVEHRAQVRAVLARAPSRENLPPLEQQPAEEVLLPKIAGCAGYSPQMKILPAEDILPVLEKTIPRALYPERYSYGVTYADDLMQNYIPVNITAYPTADWAAYYVKPMPVLYPGKVWKLVKFGNNIYQAGTSFLWSSGNKVIFLDCRIAKQPEIDEFLKAYLHKYPSSG
ncbi:MAG TPA: hypothetical protein VFQ41_18300 [Candidatus Angelobacter sp.]|nr:hypothetical protein [Candidatus Angelobacter sp.]